MGDKITIPPRVQEKVCDEIVTEGAAVTARRTPLDHQEEGVGRLSPSPFFRVGL